MKLRTLLLAFLLVVGVALGGASLANASSVVSTPTTLWEPTTSGAQELFNFSFGTCVRNIDLYINAPGATQDFTPGSGNALLLQITPNQISASEFSVVQSNGTWSVYNVTNGGNTFLLNLGSTDQFGLYYKDYGANGNSPYVLQPTINSTGSSNQWYLTDGIDGCGSVYIGNAAPVASPVPIPGTLMLFGSGLAGVFGFLRRFWN
jgi:hypothetical protein